MNKVLKTTIAAAMVMLLLPSPVVFGNSDPDGQGALDAGRAAYQAKDYVTAMKSFREAASHNHNEAQWLLGYSYQFGRGLLMDEVTAYMWYSIAAANGHASALGWRGYLGRLLPQDSVITAQQRAQRCIASEYADCD